jgi:CrcB protein
MMTYLWIAIGSALGGMARHWCTLVATKWLGAAFPWGTLFINIRICGGYTTFSAFSLQTLSLFQEGAWGRGGAYIVASVALCLLAVWIGYALAAAINRAST